MSNYKFSRLKVLIFRLSEGLGVGCFGAARQVDLCWSGQAGFVFKKDRTAVPSMPLEMVWQKASEKVFHLRELLRIFVLITNTDFTTVTVIEHTAQVMTALKKRALKTVLICL